MQSAGWNNGLRHTKVRLKRPLPPCSWKDPGKKKSGAETLSCYFSPNWVDRLFTRETRLHRPSILFRLNSSKFEGNCDNFCHKVKLTLSTILQIFAASWTNQLITEDLVMMKTIFQDQDDNIKVIVSQHPSTYADNTATLKGPFDGKAVEGFWLWLIKSQQNRQIPCRYTSVIVAFFNIFLIFLFLEKFKKLNGHVKCSENMQFSRS